MNRKEKVIVYPYDMEFAPLLRHTGLIADYEIISVISPEGWGVNGKNAGYVDKGKVLDIDIDNDFESKLNLCEGLLISESSIKLDFMELVYPKIINAVEAGKNIICARELENEMYEKILEKCKKHNVNFKYFNYCKNDKKIEPIKIPVIKKMNTPLIFVLGLGEKTHKFEIQLALRESFLGKGYKVCQVGSRNYCEILGFHSFPQFMNNSSITEAEKVIMFNNYIKTLEFNEKPDVMIIGIPGGIMRFNDQFTNEFGILAYEICQAVSPDVSICSVLYEDYKPEFFTKLSNSIKYRLGLEVSGYNLANMKFDWVKSKEDNNMSYVLLESEFIDEKIKDFSQLDTPVYNILNDIDSDAMANLLEDQLADYGQILCI